MKLVLVALALAAAPSGLAMSPFVPDTPDTDIVTLVKVSLNRAPRNAETWRAQVDGDGTEIVNDGKVDEIFARLPRPLLLLSLCGP